MKCGLRVGLTGGIASGKTTVSGMFRSLGVPVIDADEVAREITMPGKRAYNEIVSLFGKDIVDDKGYLKRELIKEIIFSRQDMKEKLEKIIHPMVREEMESRMSACNYPYCILSIPLLVETNSDYRLDRILAIDVPEKEQLERVIKRDKISEELALSIINSQASRERRFSVADDVIKNTGDLNHIEMQVRVLHEKYLELASTSITNKNSSSERSVNLH